MCSTRTTVTCRRRSPLIDEPNGRDVCDMCVYVCVPSGCMHDENTQKIGEGRSVQNVNMFIRAHRSCTNINVSHLKSMDCTASSATRSPTDIPPVLPSELKDI